MWFNFETCSDKSELKRYFAIVKLTILNLTDQFPQNNYLASRLGGKLFDAICKFEQNSWELGVIGTKLWRICI